MMKYAHFNKKKRIQTMCVTSTTSIRSHNLYIFNLFQFGLRKYARFLAIKASHQSRTTGISSSYKNTHFCLTFLLSVTLNSFNSFSTLSLMFAQCFFQFFLYEKLIRCLTHGVLMRSERKRQIDGQFHHRTLSFRRVYSIVYYTVVS